MLDLIICAMSLRWKWTWDQCPGRRVRNIWYIIGSILTKLTLILVGREVLVLVAMSGRNEPFLAEFLVMFRMSFTFVLNFVKITANVDVTATNHAILNFHLTRMNVELLICIPGASLSHDLSWRILFTSPFRGSLSFPKFFIFSFLCAVFPFSFFSF